eukprot:6391885-Lingulodinium_polyedra.AAC.1
MRLGRGAAGRSPGCQGAARPRRPLQHLALDVRLDPQPAPRRGGHHRRPHPHPSPAAAGSRRR